MTNNQPMTDEALDSLLPHIGAERVAAMRATRIAAEIAASFYEVDELIRHAAAS